MGFGSVTSSLMPLHAVSRKHSLSTKLLISILVWVFFAVVFTGYTLALLWQLESGGIIINESGTLRMRIYHIAMLMDKSYDYKVIQQEQKTFEEILERVKNIDRHSFLLSDDNSIRDQINIIEKSWHTELKPLVIHYHTSGQSIDPKDLVKVDQVVAMVDKLVKLIEMQNTRHISLLRFIQSLLVLMVLVSAFTAIYLLYRLVIRPLTRLQSGIQCLSQGKLDSRIVVIGKDEFGIVSSGFNHMASNLEDAYDNLEQKVREKTAALEEKNRELSDLYGITVFLQESHTQEMISEGFLLRIIGLSNADAGSIRLLDERRNRLNYVASHGLPNDFLADKNCHSLDCFCGQSVVRASTEMVEHKYIARENANSLKTSPCAKSPFNHFVIFHIHHNNQELGVLTLYFHNHSVVLSQQDELLIETLARQFAVALENQQLVLRDRQLAVMEERNLIAQGLHDSIAQSLSFLNIQVQVLQGAIKNKEFERVDKSLNFIQQGIQESYDDVRELLLNFRTRMSREDFSEAVRSVLDRFKQQSKVTVTLNMFGNGPSLNPQQQLQVIFILQEALSNIRKHAKCDQVVVTIENNDDFLMSIQDNGCGFTVETVESKKAHHVGMSIMQERATQVLGKVKIESAINKGTCITLTIAKEQRGIL